MKKQRLSLFLAVLMAVQMLLPAGSALAAETSDPQAPAEDTTYVVPVSPNVDYNMNLDWKFYMPEGDNWPLSAAQESVRNAFGGKEFYDPALDDSSWETVSVPHTFNDGELFDSLITGAGDAGTRCITFYRKHFSLDEEHAGKKIFLEFEGVRQAAYLYVNGQFVGYYEHGVDPFGFDISEYVQFGSDQDNVIAVALDNTSARGMTNYMSETRPGSTPGSNDGVGYQWNTNDFNPTVGGLTRDVILHVKNDVYQTLPLYSNLKTIGAYVYGSDFDIPNKTATITVEAEVRNESESAQDLTLEVAVVDRDGMLWYHFASEANVTVPVAQDKGAAFQTVVPDDAYAEDPAPTDTSTVEVKTITASARVSGLHLWSTKDSYLYQVYSILKDSEGNVLDVTEITTGFRKVESKGGVDGGIYINDELVWLTGYAQRSTNEWAAIGVAPDWMHDYDMELVRQSNANFIRWMHVAAQPADIRACDKYGIACVQPAGDKEGDVSGRQWDQRVEAMRDTIIYFRNSPSILFWEAGNSSVSVEHMKEMTDLRKQLDPHGGRSMGCRALADEMAAVDASEYVGTMLGRKVYYDGKFTGNGEETRDKRAIVESEYYREEAPRRVWDDFSPPDFDYKHGPTANEGDAWDMTAEDFVINSAGAYMEFYNSRVGANSKTPVYSAAAALCWTDSIQHGRNTQTENARMSGRVDPARNLKQSFYAFQVLQSTKPSIYLVGHWNYPTDPSVYPEGRDPKNKTVYVLASNCKYVELFINGQSVGKNGSPSDGFVYAFPGIDITQCTEGSYIEAVSYNSKGEELARHKIETAGEAASIRLMAHTGPQGLLADGSDVAFVDVEIVDAQGRVLPLDYSELKLSVEGPAELRGGYNSGYIVNYGEDQVNAAELNRDPSTIRAECGTNRVFLRAGYTAGDITLTVKREGLPDASITLTSQSVETTGGLTTQMPQQIADPGIVPEPEPEPSISGMKPVAGYVEVKFGEGGNTVIVKDEGPEVKVVDVYVNDNKVDFGTGTSGTALTAYETASCVFGPVEPFLKALGAEYNLPKPGDVLESTPLTIKVGDKTVTLTGSLMTNASGQDSTINQMAEFRDGVLYAELSAIARGFGFQTNDWTSGMTEFRVTTGKTA